MADVFVSYASANRDHARQLADFVDAQGWTIWWDRDIPIGTNFQSAIASALSSARCVSVIWSRASVVSNWVLEEAEEGKNRNVLLPVQIDDAPIPIGFRLIQAANLVGWRGERNHPGVATLMQSIGSVLGAPPELPFAEAVRLIRKFCEHRKVDAREIEPLASSSTGAKFYRAWAKDRMGAVYCHASGGYIGQVYYVRKGIGIYFHDHIGGAASALGLPISNEELVDSTGRPTTFFENGYIDWSPKTWEARAIVVAAGGETPLGKPAVV